MANYEILSQEAVSQSEVSEVIKKIAKDRELTYREEKVNDFLKKSTVLKKKDFETAKKELEELQIPRIEDSHIIKVLDLMPKNGTELRSIISHGGMVLVDENITKILDVLKKYR